MIEGSANDTITLFHPAVQKWFTASFAAPTPPQIQGWPAIAKGDSTLILAPTGTGKTLAAFLWGIQRVMFEPLPEPRARCRILYVSPLKALAVDVERNLRAPLIGIAQAADHLGASYTTPVVSMRTGDAPASERARFQRTPGDFLITTPESLYLLLTSNAREALRSVHTVIIDEIHSLVPTKRGAHLALSMERLESLCGRRLQRIGLSATQRPLEEVAHYLGGAESVATSRSKAMEDRDATDPSQDAAREFAAGGPEIRFRPITIIHAGNRKQLNVTIETPVEDMAQLGRVQEFSSGPASQPPARTSIWTAIHPKLLELIRGHRSTLLFVNSRRLAERLASALNDLAGETWVRAHHGSLSLAQRQEVEDRLKAGTVKGLVATSSLELGIDMGAVDLVVQIEAPPSVASGLQRIGRAGHQVNAVSQGIIFPKYRADLVACAAAARAMREGQVEAIRYPRNALDVLAQQIVATVAMDIWKVEDLFKLVRRAAPYANLSVSIFESVLDMLAGRYPSDEFAELRPRLTWDRVKGTLTAREGARRMAVLNGGTIPNRGTYGVFLVGADKGGARVGELDEEMVFESRRGDTFLLGASTWRVEEITHDRVLVSPAPGEPGKMPFWHGDAAGRPMEFGETIGKLVRELRSAPPGSAIRTLMEHDLDRQAAENLLRYISEQAVATERVPDDRTIVIERVRDELGDWRICVLTPFGSKIHAPWCMAVTGKIQTELGLDVETMWSDDGFVVRLPESEQPPDSSLFLPTTREIDPLVLRQVGRTALFAAKFREVAARALLLPKRRPGMRAPLWQQRKKAADLLAVASRYGSFPMLLETYRECLRDVFDMPALIHILQKIETRVIHVTTVDSPKPSPFAGSLLFSYIANYIYEGDAPLAERRAQALSIDHAQLRDLLGEADLRELLDPASLEAVELQLQALDQRYRARHADGLHDLLLRIGDLTKEEIVVRCESADVAESLEALLSSRRVVSIRLQGETRYIAIEDAARYRDALGVPLPQGLPDSLLRPVQHALIGLVRRYARTHGPFTTQELIARFGLTATAAAGALKELHATGNVLEGEFRPGGLHHEWCDAEVLGLIKRKSLAKLRQEVEPVDQRIFARLLTHWQGVIHPRAGLDTLLDAVEMLQGAPLPASILERQILSARVREYKAADLDTLLAAGEIIWRGVEPSGDHDGRLALYLTDHLPLLLRPPGAGPSEASEEAAPLSERASAILDILKTRGASFFQAIHDACGGGYPGDTVDALWDLVWRGLVTNDTLHPLRSFTRREAKRSGHRRDRESTGMPQRSSISSHGFRSRRAGVPSAQGRWSLVAFRRFNDTSLTAWSAALAQQLLHRYGVLTREVAAAENIPGGFSVLYPALKTMEESGRIRRGMFVAGVGATQFAMPAALDLLRSLKDDPDIPEVVHLASTDPANPYGALLKWPILAEATEFADQTSDGKSDSLPLLSRSIGTSVLLVNGVLAAYLRRRNPDLLVFLPAEEPAQGRVARAVSGRLADLIVQGQSGRGSLIAHINGRPAGQHALAPFLEAAGFVHTPMGFHLRRRQSESPSQSTPHALLQPKHHA